MKKRSRLVIVLAVILLCGYFLYPTIKWYGFVPQDTKELATGSNVQIKEYARGQASRDLRSLKDLVAQDPAAALPAQYSYLKDSARSPRHGRWKLSLVDSTMSRICSIPSRRITAQPCLT